MIETSSSSSTWAVEALATAEPAVFWSDRPDAPEPAGSLRVAQAADLAIVGGGFTGLWAAIQALEAEPGIDVAVLEAERCGFGASSRNGGFCDGSLTHGLENGLRHWPDEIETLQRLGSENFEGIEATIDLHGIDAGFRRAPEIAVAVAPWHLSDLEESFATHQTAGDSVELYDGHQMRERVNSPTFLGGLARQNDIALVDPARLCWGLAAAARALGASLFEGTPVVSIEDEGDMLRLSTPGGSIRARRVIVATNAYPAPIRQPHRYLVPVYDYVLMTEPLDAAQLKSIGWEGREGLGDMWNQFHYFRMTEDDRILWGGHDVKYHYKSAVRSDLDQNEAIHRVLAENFFTTFPQLDRLRFTHRWGGPIATTTRFAATWGTQFGGRLSWAAGYTGLGVAASRFGAATALDLVFDRSTERSELEMVREKPFPFPPEPFRWGSVAITKRAIRRADRRDGRRGAWLGLLDRLGIGFDA